jgi:hypothetical protein
MSVRRPAGLQRLRQVLDDREEALATLLEQAGDPRVVLRRLRDGAPQWLTSTGYGVPPVVRVPLKGGVPGEVLDIQLRDADSPIVERVLYRCLAISSRDSIEATQWEDYTATWHAAQFFAQEVKVQSRSRATAVRVVSAPTRPQGPQCSTCGRRRLSREEYNWRRRNGYAVWRCQHRRPSPKRHRDLVQSVGVVVAVAVTALALAM